MQDNNSEAPRRYQTSQDTQMEKKERKIQNTIKFPLTGPHPKINSYYPSPNSDHQIHGLLSPARTKWPLQIRARTRIRRGQNSDLIQNQK